MNGKIAHVVSLSIYDTIDDAKYCSVIQYVQASNIILLGPLAFVNFVHIYTLLKSKYDS